jgi:hypothetical protein
MRRVPIPLWSGCVHSLVENLMSEFVPSEFNEFWDDVRFEPDIESCQKLLEKLPEQFKPLFIAFLKDAAIRSMDD